MKWFDYLALFAVLVVVVFFLTACESLPPKIETVRVEIPVPAPCLGPAPAQPMKPKNKPESPASALALIQAYIADLEAYSSELRAQMAGCR